MATQAEGEMEIDKESFSTEIVVPALLIQAQQTSAFMKKLKNFLMNRPKVC